jgi:hypothetical protein
MLEILPNIFILCCGPLRRMIFYFEYLGEIEVEFEMASGYESGD